MNALAYAYYVWYCPGTVLALWVTERYGLRFSLLAGFATQLVMVCLSVFGFRIVSPHGAYWTLWTGTLIGSLGQPLFINNITRLAADWFPIEERDWAVTISTVARSLGVMTISAVAPFVVTQPSQIARLYDWQLPTWLAISAAGLWLCADRPQLPPSASAATLWATEDEAAALPLPPGGSHAKRALQEIWSHTVTLCGLPNFLYLAFSYSLITGVGWAFLTAVGQFLEPCGYSTYTAGAANAVLMGATVLGCFAAAPLVEHTRAYLPLQRSVSWATLVATGGVLYMARAGAVGWVLTTWALLGFTMGPLTPVSFEHACEMTFPVPAQASSAILIVLSNLVGFVETVVVTFLLQRGVAAGRDQCDGLLTPAAGFILSVSLIGATMTHFVREDYRRQAAEAGEGDGEAATERTSLLRAD